MIQSNTAGQQAGRTHHQQGPTYGAHAQVICVPAIPSYTQIRGLERRHLLKRSGKYTQQDTLLATGTEFDSEPQSGDGVESPIYQFVRTQRCRIRFWAKGQMKQTTYPSILPWLPSIPTLVRLEAITLHREPPEQRTLPYSCSTLS